MLTCRWGGHEYSLMVRRVANRCHYRHWNLAPFRRLFLSLEVQFRLGCNPPIMLGLLYHYLRQWIGVAERI